MPEYGGAVRRIVQALLLVASLLPLQSLAILNGIPAEAEPAVVGSTVAVVIEDRSKTGPDGRPGYYPSTGIVVARDWILTVKHALAEYNGPQHVWQVHLMPEIRGASATTHIHEIGRNRVVFHPTLDLALIQLDGVMPFQYRPARIVADDRHVARDFMTTGMLAGYGTTGRSAVNRLRFVDAPITALSLVATGRWPDLVPRNQLDAHMEIDQRSGRGSCSGDSGGPVFVRLATGGIGLLGVIRGNASYNGAHPCQGYSYAIRLDRALPWLTEVTGRIYDPASMMLVEAGPDTVQKR